MLKVVILDKLWIDAVSISLIERFKVKADRVIIKLRMMIRANANDIAENVGSVVGFSEWSNMVRLSIPGSIRQDDHVPTNLAAVVMHDLHSTGQGGVPNNPICSRRDSIGRGLLNVVG